MTTWRLSVAAPSGVVDVALPASTPVITFLPALADMAGMGGLGARSPALCRVDGTALDTALSLADSGITNGDVLVMTWAQPSPARQPSFDAARNLARPAPAQAASSACDIAATVACGLTGLVAITFIGWSGARVASVIAATTAAACTSVGGFIIQRVPAPVKCGIVALLCGTAGSLAVPGGPSAANAVLGVTATATVAVLSAHLTHVSESWVVAVTVIAAAMATATVTAALLNGRLPAVGVGLAIVALCCLSGAARIAMVTVGISVPENEFGVRHADRAGRARDVTTGLTIGFSVLAGVGVAVTSLGTLLHDRSRIGTVAFGAVATAALLLRVRADGTHAAWSITGGLIGAGAVVTLVAATWPAYGAWLSAAVVAAPTAIWTINATNSFRSPTLTRCLDFVGHATLAATVPLGLWVCGLYGFARELTLP